MFWVLCTCSLVFFRHARKEAIMPCLDAWSNDKFLGSEFTVGDTGILQVMLFGGNKHYLGNHNKVWKAVYCKSAIVYTEMPTTLKKFIRQQIRWKSSLEYFSLLFLSISGDRNAYGNDTLLPTNDMVFSITIYVTVRSLVYLPLQGHYIDAVVYVSRLDLVGLLFAPDFKLRNRRSGQNVGISSIMVNYGLLSDSLEYYSILTIKDKSWLTR